MMAGLFIGCSAKDAMPATSNQPIELGAKQTRVVVKAQPLAAGRTAKLVVRGMRIVDRQPGVLYHLYLSLPAGKKPAKKDPRYIGSINFFNASRGNDENDRVFYTFDLSKVARQNSGATTVTFIPAGTPKAKAFVSRIELVEQ